MPNATAVFRRFEEIQAYAMGGDSAALAVVREYWRLVSTGRSPMDALALAEGAVVGPNAERGSRV